MPATARPRFPQAFSQKGQVHQYDNKKGFLRGYRIWSRYDPSGFHGKFFVYLHFVAKGLDSTEAKEDMEAEADGATDGRFNLRFRMDDPAIDYQFDDICEGFSEGFVIGRPYHVVPKKDLYKMGSYQSWARSMEFHYDQEVLDAAGGASRIKLVNNWQKTHNKGKELIDLGQGGEQHLLSSQSTNAPDGRVMQFQSYGDKAGSWLKKVIELHEKKKAGFTHMLKGAFKSVTKTIELNSESVARIFVEEAYGSMNAVDVMQPAMAGLDMAWPDELVAPSALYDAAPGGSGALHSPTPAESVAEERADIIQTATIVFKPGHPQ